MKTQCQSTRGRLHERIFGWSRQRGNASAGLIAAVAVAASAVATFYTENLKNKIDLQSRLNIRQDTHESMFSSLVVLNRLFTHDPSRASSLPAIYPVPYRGICGQAPHLSSRARNAGVMWDLGADGRTVAVAESVAKKTTFKLEEWQCDNVFPQQIRTARVSFTTTNDKGAPDLKEQALVTIATPPAPRCEIVMYSPLTARAGDSVQANAIWGILGLRVAGIAVDGEIGIKGGSRARVVFRQELANNVYDVRPHDMDVGVTANLSGSKVFYGVARAVDGTLVDCGSIAVNGLLNEDEEEKEKKKADLYLPEADPNYDKEKDKDKLALEKAKEKDEIAQDAADAQDQIFRYPRLYGCFAAGTQILMADGTLRRIEAIGEGDLVWNPVLHRAVPVRRAYAGPEMGYMREITMNGQSVRVTSGHPFYTDKGVVSAADLTADAVIPTAQGTWEPVESIRWVGVGKDPMVYNLDLDASDDPEEHLLMSNGIISGDWWLQMRLKDGEAP